MQWKYLTLKKKMITLTNKELESYANKKTHILWWKFEDGDSKIYPKVRDHDH